MSILLTFFLAFAPVFAQNTADEAELNFQLARDAYQQGDFESALFHFMMSNRLSPNRNVTFNIGRTYHALRRYPEAYRWYYDALHAAEPTSERVLAQIQDSLDRLRPQVALLKVETDPPGATVYLRRKNLGAVGVTPMELPLDPNSYNVIVELEGYEDVETGPVDLTRRGTVEDVSLSLVRIVGQLAVQGEAGATMHLGTEDGPLVCTLPCTADVPVGTQILYFKKPGFRSLPSLVEVVRGESQDVTAELLPITGTVVIDADERGALIEVDGVPAGYTPAVLSDVQVGAHTVRISARGYEPVEVPVEVEEGETLDMGRQMMNPRFTVTAASRFAEELSDAPASVTIIPREEIRAFGYQSIAEAVTGNRGIYHTYDLQYTSLGVRGFNRLGDYNNRLLISIDGHRWNDSNLFGASYVGGDSITDLGDVEQIEVVRGPGSALYGSNAFLGVLNIVTKSGASEYRSHVTVTAAEQAIRGRIGHAIGNDEVGAWASISGLYAPGRTYVFDEYRNTPSRGVSRDADEASARTIAAKAWAGPFTVHGVYVGREKETPNGAFGVNLGDHRASSNDYRGFVEARYNGGTKSTRVDTRVAIDFYRNRWFGPYGSAYFYQDRHDESWVTGLFQLNQDVGRALSFTLGLNTRQNLQARLSTITQPALGVEPTEEILDVDTAVQIYSAYGVIDIHPGEVFRLNLGGRFDQYNAAGESADFSDLNPRGALILSPGDETLKFVAGTAFRAPSSFERYYEDGVSVAAPVSLEPEAITTGDFEWSHKFSEVLTTTFNTYYNEISSLIDDEVDADGLVQKTNLTRPVRTLGAEFEVRRWWRSGWTFAAQASWQRTRSGDLFAGEELTNSPVLLASFLGAAPLGRSVTLATKVRGETPRLTRAGRLTDGAVIWDLTLTGQLSGPNVHYGVGVRNLLDWPELHPGGADVIIDQLPQLGRNLFATLKAEF